MQQMGYRMQLQRAKSSFFIYYPLVPDFVKEGGVRTRATSDDLKVSSGINSVSIGK